MNRVEPSIPILGIACIIGGILAHWWFAIGMGVFLLLFAYFNDE